jgi:ABC-type dipeptide/oligopeptide/nickel transport system permease subunit
VLSRLLAASRMDLFIACAGILCALALGVPLGLIAGYVGGRADAALSAIIDSMLTFPTLILAVILVSLLGSGTTSLVLAVTLTAAPAIARVARGLAMELRDKDFVEAAKAQGTSVARILRRHLLPNAVGRVVVVASVLASQSILTVTALGFLGLGVQPPAPEWGNMLVNSRTYLLSQPSLMLYPGLAISGFILGVNLIGDMLRDVLDVRTTWSQ